MNLNEFLQIVTAYKPKDSDKSLALAPLALEKNRNTNFIPLYPKRVKLPFLPGVEGSDYINATYLQVSLGSRDIQEEGEGVNYKCGMR